MLLWLVLCWPRRERRPGGGRGGAPTRPPPRVRAAGVGGQERFARLARAHTQNNARINAVLEPCGRGVRKP